MHTPPSAVRRQRPLYCTTDKGLHVCPSPLLWANVCVDQKRMYKNVQRHTAKAAHGEGRTRHPRMRYVAQLLQIRFGSQPSLFPVFVANNTSRKRLIVEKTAAKSCVSCNPISTMLHCKNLSTRLLVAVTACQPPPPARPSHGSAADRPPGAKGTGPTTGELGLTDDRSL